MQFKHAIYFMSIWAAKHRNNVATAYAISFVCTLSLPHLHEITSPSFECADDDGDDDDAKWWSCWQLQLPQHIIIICVVDHQCGGSIQQQQRHTPNNNHIQCRQNRMVFAYPHNSTLDHCLGPLFCSFSRTSCTHTRLHRHGLKQTHTHTHASHTNGKLILRTNEVEFVFNS